MKKFFKLSNDYMYKLVMSNSNIMSTFLERTLDTNIDNLSIIDKYNNKIITPIKVKEYLMQELSNINVHVKRKSVDLLVKTKDSIVDLEYNGVFNEETIRRNYAYISSVYANSLKKSKKYKKMPNIMQINICSNISKDYDIDNHFITGKKYNKILVDNINIIVINVAKYKSLLYTNNERLIMKYAHIIMFDCNKKELKILSRYDSFVKEVYRMLNEYNNDDNIYSFLMDEESQKNYMESMIEGEKDRARKSGMELGLKRGEKLGLERGERRGMEKAKLQTAKKMLSKNFSLQDIQDITGLKKEYLKALKI